MNNLIEFTNEYFKTKLNTETWEELDDTQKEKYIAEASRNVLSISGINLPEEYGTDVKTAISEVCYEILTSSDTETFNKLQRAGVSSISCGNDSVSFVSDKTSKNSYINDYAKSILDKYIQRSYRVV